MLITLPRSIEFNTDKIFQAFELGIYQLEKIKQLHIYLKGVEEEKIMYSSKDEVIGQVLVYKENLSHFRIFVGHQKGMEFDENASLRKIFRSDCPDFD